MKILDKYIIREFIKLFTLCSLAFPFVFVIADIVNNLDKFENVPGKWVLLYYIYQMPYIFVLIVPFGVLISVLLSLGNLAKNSEVIAMKASGISLYRISMPVMFLAVLIYFFTLFITNAVIPPANFKSQQIYRLRIRKQISIVDTPNRVHLGYKGMIEEETFYVYIRYFDGQLLKVNDIKIFFFNEDGIETRRIDAKHAKWNEAEGWVGYSGVVERKFSAEGDIISIERTGTRPLYFYLRPEDLARVEIDPENMSYSALKRKIDDLKQSGENVTKLLVELHLKIAYPFTNVIIALLAIPFGANITRRGLAKGFGIGLIIVIVFLTVVKFSITLGSGGVLSPFLSAWIANFVFAGLGAVLFQKAKM
ncbi:MAG TPA: LPS export ABC transporter permease LptG [Firmicutes bacterium]|nr:LPS export ABC transporter permease LptG [Bacillota bacterium]